MFRTSRALWKGSSPLLWLVTWSFTLFRSLGKVILSFGDLIGHIFCNCCIDGIITKAELENGPALCPTCRAIFDRTKLVKLYLDCQEDDEDAEAENWREIMSLSIQIKDIGEGSTKTDIARIIAQGEKLLEDLQNGEVMGSQRTVSNWTGRSR